MKEKIEHVRAKAEAKGRKLTYGIRLHVIVRETNEQAWAAANELIQYLDDATIAAAQKKFAQMDSVGQQRMGSATRRQPRQARSLSKPLGWYWFSPWWCRYGTCR